MTELKYWENPYIIKENKEDGTTLRPPIRPRRRLWRAASLRCACR